jgi:hypothetical protein
MKLTQDNLLNRYLQAVGFWLPRQQKDDILAELSEDLHQQMEDREEELGHSLGDAEIKAILKQRGQPLLVARSFLPQRSLISPVLYPIYIVVLKIVLLVTLGFWLVGSLIGAILSHTAAANPLAGVANSLGSAWNVFFIQFGIITLIFALIDRYAAVSIGREDWDPGKLARVRPPQATKRRLHAAAGVVVGILGFVWLLSVPNYPFLLMGPAALMVKAAPIWSEVYLSLLLLTVAGIVEDVVILLRPDLRWVHSLFRLGITAFSFWIGYRLLQTHTYVVALDAHAVQYISVINLMAQLAITGSMIGLAIALCVHVWQAVRELSQSVQSTNVGLA